MSLVSKAFELRLDAIEQEMSEIRQNMTVVSMAIIRLTKLVEEASEMLGSQSETGEAAEHVLPEAPESSD